MGNENVLFVHNGIIFRWKAKFTHEIGMYIDGHKKDYIEWYIPNSERQIVHVLSHQHLCPNPQKRVYNVEYHKSQKSIKRP